jgi:hypothetical protein
MPRAIDCRDHAEPPLATMRALLDIDAGQALHERRGRLGRLRGRQRELQDGPTAPETRGPVPIAQHPVMANTNEACWEHMEQLCGEANYVAREA